MKPATKEMIRRGCIVVSGAWLVFAFGNSAGARSFDVFGFFVCGILPVVLGWGIRWIVKGREETR